eukprot:5198118-Prymnesium_polylepis.1
MVCMVRTTTFCHASVACQCVRASLRCCRYACCGSWLLLGLALATVTTALMAIGKLGQFSRRAAPKYPPPACVLPCSRVSILRTRVASHTRLALLIGGGYAQADMR